MMTTRCLLSLGLAVPSRSLVATPVAPSAVLAATVAKCGAEAPGDRLLRVTTSDVATSCGVDLATARMRLAALSAEVPGSCMEVSNSGVLVYAFPRDVEQAVRQKRDARPDQVLLSAARACVGLLLVTSVATLRPLIDRRVWRGAEGVSLRRELQVLRAELLEPASRGEVPFSDCADGTRPNSLGLACYGFMFGEDGGECTVAAAQRERQYAAVAAAIRANKGAVCADQLRPFLLECPRSSTSDATENVLSLRPVDDFMVPIIARFDGQPSVTQDGEIIYTFPELLPTAGLDVGFGHYPTSAPLVRGAKSVFKSLTGPQPGDYLEEPYRRFLVGEPQQIATVALANLVAAVILGALLGPWQLALRMRGGSYAMSALVGVNVAYGALLTNGFAWVVLPAARRIKLWGYNLGVRRRNRLRRAEAAKLTDPLQPAALRRRLQAAHSLGQKGRRQVKGGSEALYTTAKSLLEQAATQKPLLDAWDVELRKKTRGTGG
jgi:hypothetical protein